jgi:hypothetical protein
MANRNWASGGKIYSMHVSPVMIDSTITIGISGAVDSIKGPLISSVTQESTGVYKLNLQDNFMGLLTAVASMQSPLTGLSGIVSVEIQNSPSTDVTVLGGASITIKTLDATGALADPADGSSINVLTVMSNSSVRIQGE